MRLTKKQKKIWIIVVIISTLSLVISGLLSAFLR